MRTQLLRVTTLAFTATMFAAACGESPTGTASELNAPLLAKGGKPGKPMVTIPITVEFRVATGDRFSSDGGGAYTGIFRESGSLIFMVNETTRKLCFDFPEIPDADLFFPEDGCYDGYLSTHQPGAFQSENIFEMPVHPTDTRLTAAGVHWDSGLFHFGTNCLLEAEPANRLWATHPTESTWTLSGQRAIVCRRRLPGEKGPKTIQVEVDVPFEVTLKLVNEPQP